ncbi:GNAT family N-acetyltransferase [Flagellimonas eckloniae]|uniref:GNAT family N-acetyltransferase n=1 Tax=Flagellimonas eckloniae TaxID=346185 RepID=UPI0006DBF2C5|nr:GNAT family N-acetyltransferase [Allomuricauda eckloniae]
MEFQNFTNEIQNIEVQYSRPKGIIFIARNDENLPLGCFGIRVLEDSICELKRMFLKKEARGLGLGKQMLEKAIEAAKELGYQKMRLDTLPTMNAAIGLYKKVGFYEIEPYRFNPIQGTKYFELSLHK